MNFLSPEIITAIMGFAGAFIVKELWDGWKASRTNKDSQVEKALEKSTEAINNLNIAVVELKIRIDHLSEKLAPIPKLSADLNHAHTKIRELEKGIFNKDT